MWSYGLEALLFTFSCKIHLDLFEYMTKGVSQISFLCHCPVSIDNCEKHCLFLGTKRSFLFQTLNACGGINLFLDSLYHCFVSLIFKINMCFWAAWLEKGREENRSQDLAPPSAGCPQIATMPSLCPTEARSSSMCLMWMIGSSST